MYTVTHNALLSSVPRWCDISAGSFPSTSQTLQPPPNGDRRAGYSRMQSTCVIAKTPQFVCSSHIDSCSIERILSPCSKRALVIGLTAYRRSETRLAFAPGHASHLQLQALPQSSIHNCPTACSARHSSREGPTEPCRTGRTSGSDNFPRVATSPGDLFLNTSLPRVTLQALGCYSTTQNADHSRCSSHRAGGYLRRTPHTFAGHTGPAGAAHHRERDPVPHARLWYVEG